MILLCVASYRDLSVLYKGLELPPIGTTIKLGDSIQIQSHPNDLCFIVLRRNDKRSHVDLAKAHLHPEKTLILDRDLEVSEDECAIQNVGDLERFIPLTARGRNKLAIDLFRDDVAFLTTIVLHWARSPPPPPPPKLISHKRVRAAECVVCMDETANVLFNCGHECVCTQCCDEWMKVNQSCPVCKAAVTDLYK